MPRGAQPPPAGHTQLSRVTPTAGGQRLSLADEGRLTLRISRSCPAPGPNSQGLVLGEPCVGEVGYDGFDLPLLAVGAEVCIIRFEQRTPRYPPRSMN